MDLEGKQKITHHRKKERRDNSPLRGKKQNKRKSAKDSSSALTVWEVVPASGLVTPGNSKISKWKSTGNL